MGFKSIVVGPAVELVGEGLARWATQRVVHGPMSRFGERQLEWSTCPQLRAPVCIVPRSMR